MRSRTEYLGAALPVLARLFLYPWESNLLDVGASTPVVGAVRA